VVAVDPHSRTSPTSILDRWRHRIRVVQWTDRDFTSDPSLLERRAGDTKVERLTKHRRRQRDFYKNCTRYLQSYRNPEERTVNGQSSQREYVVQRPPKWTAYIDADEYVTVNQDALPKDAAQQLFRRPGSVLQMVQLYSNTTTAAATAPEKPDSEHQQLLQINSSASRSWYRYFQRTPCVVLPRVLFTAVESTADEIANAVPSFLDAHRFETLKWRYRATPRYNGTSHEVDDWGKSIMDVSRVRDDHYGEGKTGRTSHAHMPLTSICPRREMVNNYSKLPLGIHHYLGDRDGHFCRDDARMGTVHHKVDKWKKLSMLRAGGPDDQVRPWIRGFVDLIGDVDEVQFLLRGAGQLDGCRAEAS